VRNDSQCTKKHLKQKDKEVYDLQKENSKLKEEIQIVQSDFSNLKSQVNREAKQAERKKKESEKKEFLNVLTSESKQDDVSCKYCDKILSSEDKFRRHLLLHHTNCSSTQTNNVVLVDKKIQVKTSEFTSEKNIETLEDVAAKFENYPCNYCDYIINNKNCLTEHVVKCSGSHSQTFIQDSKPTSAKILQPKFKAS
jgi:seryl-tRNA synthetase